MGHVLEAIFEHGVLKPLRETGLTERQRVVLELHDAPVDDVEEYLNACHRVYGGLADEEIAEIEAIALDRSNFMARRL